ncbi:MAG: hypothetical protein JWM00_69 [Candidatus Saccharibacteria bacterium]|nr:hypothetical protein [Candidatus Saccharibacteria bacterium]
MSSHDDDHYPPMSDFELSCQKAVDIVAAGEYVIYATGHGQLTPLEIPSEVRSSDAFQTIADILDWPTANDADIAPIKDFTDEQLLNNLFDHDSTHERSLGNFILRLRAIPILTLGELPAGAGVEAYYGLSPELNRANVLIPDLLDALRVIYNNFPLGTEGARAAQEFLGRPENTYLLTATNTAYRVLGRLVKTTDSTSGVTDAHVALTL